jgi:hypothetical protein
MPAVGGYVVEYLSSSSQPWKAEIRCFATNAIPPVQQVAAIRFYDTTPPASGLVGGIPAVNYHLSRFSEVISILRDETHVVVDHVFYTSAGQSVDAWGVSGGIAPAAEMQPK